MPETVAAAVANWAAETFAADAIGTFLTVKTGLEVAAVVSSVYTLREQQRKAQNRARDAYNASVRDRYVMLRGATEPRKFVFGRQRVSGPIAFIRSAGADRTTLAFLVLLAAHECDAIETIYIDDEVATLDGSGNVTAVSRRDQFAISTATASVDLASEPKAGTVTAVATYGTTVVPLTVTGVTGTTVSVSGATAGVTGTLTVTYQPAANPWTATATGLDLTATITLDGSGNGSVVLTGTPLAGSVRTVAYSNPGMDQVNTDVAAYTSIVGSTVTVTGAPTPGQPVNVTYRLDESGAASARMRITKYLGTAGQTADAGLISLFPGVWTSAHVLTGQTYLKVECAFDPDAFPSGLPNISAVVRGAKLYDPRSGLTAWSENPALMARYVATHPLLGRQLASAVNDTNIAAQANICDTSVTYTVDGQAYVRPLYTAGLVVKCGTRPADVLNDLCGAMAGKWVVVDGQLRLRAGASVTPLQTLDETWLAGEIDDQPTSIEIQAQVARADVFNTATGKFADGSRDYQELDYPSVRSSSYITADGAELPLEISLLAVTFAGQAQQVVATMMRDARMGLRVTLTCNMRAFAVEPFDVLQVTLSRFGWSGKLFEVLDVQWTPMGGIQLTLKETDPAIWALGTSFSSVPLAPPTLLPSPWYVPAVTGLACYSGAGEFVTQADGTVVGTMRVAWTAITDRYVLESGGGVEVRYGLASEPESAWRTVRAIDGASSVRLADVADGRIYLVKARAFSALTKGAWSATTLHLVAAKTTGASAPSSVAATAQPGGVLITWAACPDSDYAETEVRYGASWAAGTRIYKGRGTGAVWDWPAAGSYTLRVRHRNNSGLDSTETTASITVGTNTLVDTPQLADQAATVIQEAFTSGPVSLPGAGNIASYTINNPDSVQRKVIVHCTLTYSGTASGASGGYSNIGITDGSSPVGTAIIQALPAASVSGSLAFSVTFLAPPGLTYYSVFHQPLPAPFGWGSMAFSSVTHRMELIRK